MPTIIELSAQTKDRLVSLLTNQERNPGVGIPFPGNLVVPADQAHLNFLNKLFSGDEALMNEALGVDPPAPFRISANQRTKVIHILQSAFQSGDATADQVAMRVYVLIRAMCPPGGGGGGGPDPGNY